MYASYAQQFWVGVFGIVIRIHICICNGIAISIAISIGISIGICNSIAISIAISIGIGSGIVKTLNEKLFYVHYKIPSPAPDFGDFDAPSSWAGWMLRLTWWKNESEMKIKLLAPPLRLICWSGGGHTDILGQTSVREGSGEERRSRKRSEAFLFLFKR